MKPKSNTLFHFTKNAEFLRGILLNGLIPRYCLEDVRWYGHQTHNNVAFPMVCFCDIPLSRISEHTAFYGEYGIGLTKEWGLKNKLCPVIYTPPDSTVTKLVDYVAALKFDGLPDPEELKDVNFEMFYRMMSLIKPLNGNMLIGGSPVEKDFYQESEWRHVPKSRGIIFEHEFTEKRDEKNCDMEHHKLTIAPEDIKYIFVKNDHEIPDLVDFINNKLGSFSHNSLKILTTRILSLDGISLDI